MGFKKRHDASTKTSNLSAPQKEAMFVNGADADSRTKYFNLRFTENELRLLKDQAKKNGRSMQAHLKWIFFRSIEDAQ